MNLFNLSREFYNLCKFRVDNSVLTLRPYEVLLNLFKVTKIVQLAFSHVTIILLTTGVLMNCKTVTAGIFS